VVAPSGSCAGMLKKHYPGLFRGDANWESRAEAFAAKVHELVSFLADERGMIGVGRKTVGPRDLSRFLLRPARVRHPAPAARPAVERGRG
jgi:Fe-S oxidoreductase